MEQRPTARSAIVAASLVLALIVVSPLLLPLAAEAAHYTFVPPSQAVAQSGKTYGEWSAIWWRQVAATPPGANPVLDQTGTQCDKGDQAGSPVFFLYGTFGGSVTRSCTVPANRVLFIPLVNGFAAAEGTVPEMRANLAAFVKSVSSLHASIDGEAVANLNPNTTPYRTISPEFSLFLPGNNVFGAPGGTYAPAVADGFYLMVAPLSAGNHTLRFGGATSGRNAFTVDVTYQLLVQS
jgi:hypothetical protein